MQICTKMPLGWERMGIEYELEVYLRGNGLNEWSLGNQYKFRQRINNAPTRLGQEDAANLDCMELQVQLFIHVKVHPRSLRLFLFVHAGSAPTFKLI